MRQVKRDAVSNACDGALVGSAAASLYQVYLALSDQVPQNILAPILGGTAAAALVGALVVAGGAALYERLKRCP
ncbi:hypothetical protein ILT44_22620 [Microvirga sp. BT689]|uniref:hypothetical protein n=1 Tax=Microvirga arvi TaxID=2778731 RepID=UPI0019501AB4|nr:hypothetical protein [Microvirga arvi]MBM6583002.1 hypothetical protein [Microvirga arvi]